MATPGQILRTVEKFDREARDNKVLVTQTITLYRTLRPGEVANSYLEPFGPVMKEINRTSYREF